MYRFHVVKLLSVCDALKDPVLLGNFSLMEYKQAKFIFFCDFLSDSLSSWLQASVSNGEYPTVPIRSFHPICSFGIRCY